MKQQLPQFNISKEVFYQARTNGLSEMLQRLEMRKLSTRQLRRIASDNHSTYERRMYALSELQRRSGRLCLLKILLAAAVLIAFYLLTTP